MKELRDKGLIVEEAYLDHFALLAQTRCYFLRLSPDDLMAAVLPKQGWLVTVNPRGIRYLNLQLTLSTKYGVDEGVAFRIVATFIMQILADDTITQEVTQDIFAELLSSFMKGRDPKIVSKRLGYLCFGDGDPTALLITSVLAGRKKRILRSMLDKLALGYDPLFEAFPSLLKVG